jgi:fructose-1,6-bisphosphatase/inositol monophosphatase family enzyme
VLIDEESIDGIGTPEEVFASSEYQWVLDPIDGTAAYAAGRDDWGIYLGLLHNGEPVIAAMSQPGRGLTLLADTETVWLDKQGQRSKLVPRQPELGPNGFLNFIGNFAEAGAVDQQRTAWPIAGTGSVANHMDVFLGLSNGVLSQSGYGCLWDYAVPFVIAHRLGFSWVEQHTLQPITSFGPQHVTPVWKMAVATILAPQRQIQPIATLLKNARESLK